MSVWEEQHKSQSKNRMSYYIGKDDKNFTRYSKQIKCSKRYKFEP